MAITAAPKTTANPAARLPGAVMSEESQPQDIPHDGDAPEENKEIEGDGIRLQDRNLASVRLRDLSQIVWADRTGGPETVKC
jgi:hypothetical protein